MFFIRLEISPGTTIAIEIGQAVVDLKLEFECSSSHTTIAMTGDWLQEPGSRSERLTIMLGAYLPLC